MNSTHRVIGNRVFGIAFAGLAAGALSATAADAQNLRYAIGLPDTNYNHVGAVAFAEELRENAGLNVTIYPLSLLNLNEVPGGVRDGLTDFGYTLFPYFPAEFAEVNLPANLANLVISGTPADHPGAAMIAASTEYIMLHCPDCQEQMRQRNHVYIGGSAAVDYGLVCSTPVRTLDDLNGKTVRTGTADHARFVEYFGAVAISMSGNEIYDALNTGNIDCSANTPENLVSLRYIEIADSFTNSMPGGMFAGIGPANVNRDTWARLTEDERRAVLNAAGTLALTGWMEIEMRNAGALEAFAATGRPVFEVSDADRARIDEFIAQDTAAIAASFTNLYGLQNVDEKIALISELVEKWKGLTNGIERDVAALNAVFIEHIYDKVDVSTYGID